MDDDYRSNLEHQTCWAIRCRSEAITFEEDKEEKLKIDEEIKTKVEEMSG